MGRCTSECKRWYLCATFEGQGGEATILHLQDPPIYPQGKDKMIAFFAFVILWCFISLTALDRTVTRS